MAKGMIWLTSGGFKVIEAEKAVQIWQALNGEVDPTEEQASFLTTVRDVFIPPSFQEQATGYITAHRYAKPSGIVPEGHDASKAVTDTQDVPQSDMFHQGQLQGSYQAIPENDR